MNGHKLISWFICSIMLPQRWTGQNLHLEWRRIVATKSGAERHVTIPSGVAADYVAEKLSAELSPLGIDVSSHTRVFLEMPTGVETGTIGFDIAGSNITPVSVTTSVAKGDLTGLAEAINFRSSVTASVTLSPQSWQPSPPLTLPGD